MDWWASWDIGRHYSALIQYETNSQQFLQESGRCNLLEKTSLLGLTCTSRNKVMLMMTPPWLRYFWFHSIYSLAASCSLQSAVCKCHTPIHVGLIEQTECNWSSFLWDTSIQGTQNLVPENVNIIVVFITSIKGTSDLYSEERDTFSGSGNLGLF